MSRAREQPLAGKAIRAVSEETAAQVIPTLCARPKQGGASRLRGRRECLAKGSNVSLCLQKICLQRLHYRC